MKRLLILALTSLLLTQCIEPAPVVDNASPSLRPHTAVKKSGKVLNRTALGIDMEAIVVEVDEHQWIIFHGGGYGYIDVKHHPSCPCGWQKNLAESE